MARNDLLTARLIRAALAATRIIPPHLAFWAGGLLGWWFGSLPMRDQRRCRENLARAFPTRDAAWVERTALRCFRHFGRMALWSLATATTPPQRLRRGMGHEGGSHLAALRRAARARQGTVLFTGHYGNWELACRVGGLFVPLTVIGKRLRNPHLDALIVQLRQSGGARVAYQEEDVRVLVRELRAGRALCTLADQDIPRMPGIHVDWFGIPAYTPVAPAALVMLNGGRAQAVFCFLEGRHWVLHLSPRMHFAKTADRDADIRAVTAWAMSYEEALVRRHPEQWVWWHLRWRTPPPAPAGAGR